MASRADCVQWILGLLCFHSVPLSQCLSCANIGIFVSLRTSTERNSMKFVGGNHYHQSEVITFCANRTRDKGAGYTRKFESTSKRCFHAANARLIWPRTVLSCLLEVLNNEFKYMYDYSVRAVTFRQLQRCECECEYSASMRCWILRTYCTSDTPQSSTWLITVVTAQPQPGQPAVVVSHIEWRRDTRPTLLCQVGLRATPCLVSRATIDRYLHSGLCF